MEARKLRLRIRDTAYSTGQECYLTHLTDRCRFLNCSVRMGGGENKRGGGLGGWGVGGGE
jgi:hypothetical protein